MARVLVSICAVTLLTAQAPALVPDRQVELEQLVFGLCPRVYSGDLKLTDQAAVTALGFTPTAPREVPDGAIPRVEKGQGPTKIVVAGQSGSCSIWFGGPDNTRLLRHFERKSRSNGYKGGRAGRLGDGTMLSKFVRSDAPSIIVIEADAGGEFGSSPATTIIFMPEKGD